MAGRKVDAPLAGVLFASGRIASGGPVSLCGYRRAAMELKLGFVFGQAVRAAPADPAALARAVAKVFPVVDLPDIAYRDPSTWWRRTSRRPAMSWEKPARPQASTSTP
jgi:2-keto-4-pentenoate hydratase